MIDVRNPIANPLNPDVGVKNPVSFRIHANDRRLLVIKLFPYTYIYVCMYIYALYVCAMLTLRDSLVFGKLIRAQREMIL